MTASDDWWWIVQGQWVKDHWQAQSKKASDQTPSRQWTASRKDPQWMFRICILSQAFSVCLILFRAGLTQYSLTIAPKHTWHFCLRFSSGQHSLIDSCFVAHIVLTRLRPEALMPDSRKATREMDTPTAIWSLTDKPTEAGRTSSLLIQEQALGRMVFPAISPW